MDSLLAGVDLSGGKVVLIRGEAGIGKSALIREFAERHARDATVVVGFSDNLLTPQPLGPFWDFAHDEPSLVQPLQDGDRPAVLAGCLAVLSRSPRPTALVIEDTHWADEATLDAIRYIGRRIARTNGLLVLTYRDGAVDFDHPLRVVIGELPPQNVARMRLESLSRADVSVMVGETDLDIDEVLTLTAGNPLFVNEVVASGVDHLPSSVQDSVLARAGSLSDEARRIVDLVSVSPGGSEQELVDGILGPTPEPMAECERRGLLQVQDDTVSFRHELTRRAIESALSASDRRRLNGAVMAELGDSANPSRLVHHAREADDVAAIVAVTPLAARAAMASESWREAVEHFRVLERHLARLAESDQASVLEDWSRAESYLSNVEAVDLVARAIDLRRSLADDRELARTLTFAVRVYQVEGRPDEALACANEAISILEPKPSSRELAFALSQRAWLALMRSDDDKLGLELADRALAVASETNDELSTIYALVAKGSFECGRGDRGAIALVEESHRLAQEGGYRFEEVYALVNLTGLAGDRRDIRRAADLAQRTRDAAARCEIRSLETYAQAVQAELLLWRGDWAAAEDAATEVTDSSVHGQTVAARILGTMQVRQARPQAGTMLDLMWTLAETSGELQNLDPAGAALAEHMWLTGERHENLTAKLREIFDQGTRIGPPWPSGAFVFWWWKIGELSDVPEGVPDEYRLIIEGEPLAAAEMWSKFGCPYERAIALSHGKQDAQLEALEILETLGATAVAAKLRQSLRGQGVRLARGKGRKTRSHAGGLTERQAEVLQLLAEGVTNTDIADRLFVSPRTVEHHVSAVMTKLDAASREEAVSRALDDGLLAPPDH